MKAVILISQLVMLVFCHFTIAGTDDSRDGWELSLSAGYGKIENPVRFRDDIRMYVLPGITYYGKRFYLENTHVGYSLYEQPHFYLDLVGQLNEDGFFFNFDGRNGLGLREVLLPEAANSDLIDIPDIRMQRKLSYLGGLSATWKTAVADIRISALMDLTAGHHGSEYHVALSRDLALRKLKLRLYARYMLKSATTTNYYYNFKSSELGHSSWLNFSANHQYQLGIVLAYPLTEQLDVIGQIQYNKMDSALASSPFLEATNYRNQFIGFRYRF